MYLYVHRERLGNWCKHQANAVPMKGRLGGIKIRRKKITLVKGQEAFLYNPCDWLLHAAPLCGAMHALEVTSALRNYEEVTPSKSVNQNRLHVLMLSRIKISYRRLKATRIFKLLNVSINIFSLKLNFSCKKYGSMLKSFQARASMAR